MKVWVIEKEDYDMSCVTGVAASREAAERLIKSRYPDQIVDCEELTPREIFRLSVADTDSFTIEEYEVAE